MMATSATLKMPVRIGPMPMFRKSMTLPNAMRSTRFEIRRRETSPSPTPANLDHLNTVGHPDRGEQEERVRELEDGRTKLRAPVRAGAEESARILVIVEPDRIAEIRVARACRPAS